MGGNMAPYNTATSGSATVAAAAAAGAASSGSGLPVGGATLLNYGLGGSGASALGHKHHGHQHPHHYRHSLTNRHRVLRTRSSGATHNVWDEQVLEVSKRYSVVCCLGDFAKRREGEFRVRESETK